MAPREEEGGGAGARDVLRRAGDASVLMLTSLAGGAKHGYALIKDVKGFAGVELGPGTLYGALDRLERLGLIEALPGQGPTPAVPHHTSGGGRAPRAP
jgi:PadR family transcriptional regulator